MEAVAQGVPPDTCGTMAAEAPSTLPLGISIRPGAAVPVSAYGRRACPAPTGMPCGRAASSDVYRRLDGFRRKAAKHVGAVIIENELDGGLEAFLGRFDDRCEFCFQGRASLEEGDFNPEPSNIPGGPHVRASAPVSHAPRSTWSRSSSSHPAESRLFLTPTLLVVSFLSIESAVFRRVLKLASACPLRSALRISAC